MLHGRICLTSFCKAEETLRRILWWRNCGMTSRLWSNHSGKLLWQVYLLWIPSFIVWQSSTSRELIRKMHNVERSELIKICFWHLRAKTSHFMLQFLQLKIPSWLQATSYFTSSHWDWETTHCQMYYLFISIPSGGQQ